MSFGDSEEARYGGPLVAQTPAPENPLASKLIRANRNLEEAARVLGTR